MQDDKIVLNDMEFSQDELSDLVSAGKKLREFEEGQGQTLEDMNKSWGRRGQTIGELKAQLEEAQGRINQYQTPTTPATPEDVDVVQAKQVLGNYLKEMGYVQKNEILSEVTAINEGRQLLNEMQAIESKNNPYGAESLPKFNTNEVLEYMQETGIRNPQLAYNTMYSEEISDWKAEEKYKAKPGAMYTEEGNGGVKTPPQVDVNNKNIEELVRQSLQGR